jgi:hypothetical protein
LIYQQEKVVLVPSLLIKFWDFDKELAETRPKKCTPGILLHFDNVTIYRTDDDFNRFGIKRLLHPLYSQNLAPCDFSLFKTLKNKLEGKIFVNEIEMKSKV